jgi:hypothetical protein
MGFFYPGSKKDNFSSSIFRTDKPAKKQREVFSSLESLCHAWASENVFRGRAGSSMFFENGIIYSYGHHYKAAKIHTNKAGEKLVLINEHRYSNSTGNHLSEIRSAVSHLKKLDVPNVNPTDLSDHEENILYFSNKAADSFAGVMLQKSHFYSSDVMENLKCVEKYCEFFKLKSPLPKNWNLATNDFMLILSASQRELDKRWAKRRESQKIARETKEKNLQEKFKTALDELEKNYPSKVLQWRNGVISNHDLRCASQLRTVVGKVFGREQTRWLSIKTSEFAILRVNGNKVETSQGADVPLDHALRLLKMILNKEARKGARVGHYTLESVSDLNKEPVIITIGCHKILLSEAVNVLGSYLNA